MNDIKPKPYTMKKQFTIFTIVLLFLPLILTSCKDDEESPQEAPGWLVPYMGYYEGVFEGDDTGTWNFTITYVTEFEMFVISDGKEAYSRVITLKENGTFSFSDNEIILTGGIIDYKTVAGLWEELLDGTSGTFIGEKQ